MFSVTKVPALASVFSFLFSLLLRRKAKAVAAAAVAPTVLVSDEAAPLESPVLTNKERWVLHRRIAAYAITARAFDVSIPHLHSNATFDDMLGADVQPHIRIMANMAAQIAMGGDRSDMVESEDDYDIEYGVVEWAPSLYQDHNETDLDAFRQVSSAFWNMAERLVAQNSFALKALNEAFDYNRCDLCDKHADNAVDVAMLASKLAVRAVENVTESTFEFHAI